MSIYGVKGWSFPKRWNLDFSKLKKFADENFRFDDSGRVFSKMVENTVQKGEIAPAIFPFPTVFTKAYNADMQKQGLVWERVN